MNRKRESTNPTEPVVRLLSGAFGTIGIVFGVTGLFIKGNEPSVEKCIIVLLMSTIFLYLAFSKSWRPGESKERQRDSGK